MTTQKKYTAAQIKEIGERVHHLRKMMKLTQEELGKQIRESHDVIQRIESGKLKDVDERRLLTLAQPLNCNPNYLLLESDESANPHTKPDWYLSPPKEDLVGYFIHEHANFLHDIYYMVECMHPEFQNEILSLIHTQVLFHRAAVHHPRTYIEKQRARELRPSDIASEDTTLGWDPDENIFEKVFAIQDK